MTVNDKENKFLVAKQDWNAASAKFIQNKIFNKTNNKKRLILTGGETVKPIYKYIDEKKIMNLNNLQIFLSDERCVPNNHNDSNYKNIISHLFKNKDDGKRILSQIHTDSVDKHNEAKRYAKLLSDKIDLILLSLGSDSHIASLFPGDELIMKKKSHFVFNEKQKRFTITHKVLQNTIIKIIIVSGKNKGYAFESCYNNNKNYIDYPGSFLLNDAFWLFDMQAAEVIHKEIKKKLNFKFL